MEPLEVPYLVTAFRDDDGRTRFETHFALPIGVLSEEAGPGIRTLDVEVGCALLDGAWHTVHKDSRTKRLLPVPDRDAAAIDFCQMTAPPDSYHVAFHVRPVQTKRLGGYRFDKDVTDLSGPGLKVSDMLPATAIVPAAGESRFNRGGFYVTANPFRRFSVRQPVFLYFEVYDLSFDADDHTRYTLAYALSPAKDREKFLGLFGKSDQPALTLQATRSGTDATARDYAELDVSKVDPGTYTLTLRVTDEVTGRTVERTTLLELTE